MKSKLSFLIAVIAILIYFFYGAPKKVTHISSSLKKEKAPAKKVKQTKSSKKLEQSKKIKIEDLEGSLSFLSQISRSLSKANIDPISLKRKLEQLELEPVAVKDANPYTGHLKIIRTQSNLPGTRFFHAQFMGGGEQKDFLQLLSYEVKGGPKEFKHLTKNINKYYKVQKLAENQKNFKLWKLKNDYLLWIKIMSKEDKEDHPYNAYALNDSQSIRVVIEKDIHSHHEYEE